MKIYLAGDGSDIKYKFQKQYTPYILDSFYLFNKGDGRRKIQYVEDWDRDRFLLDSGAFTFMNGSHKGKVDFTEYNKRYGEFIKRYGITQFFELDVDSIVGYEKVKSMRRELERITGRQPIPVWHISRGKEDFKSSCKDYPYVAIGGIVTKEFRPEKYQYFPWFIDTAHEAGARIHGLGYTSFEGLRKYHFDSVDSTSWLAGSRFGFVYKFNGESIIKYDVPEGKRLSARAGAVNNLIEWIKYQKYAERHL
ncbi:MAG: hypothetical protein WCS04_08195 [Sphaerochaetaceae bacterium]